MHQIPCTVFDGHAHSCVVGMSKRSPPLLPCAASSAATSSVGTGYTTTASGGTLSGAASGNYTISYVTGSFAVTPARLFVTAASGTSAPLPPLLAAAACHARLQSVLSHAMQASQ